MKSIKTAFVVVVMLVVVYGVWQMINKKPIGPPPGVGDMMAWNASPLEIAPGDIPTITPPTVQAPAFNASAATTAGGSAVMPELRPAPPTGTASPFPGAPSHDHVGHDGDAHATNIPPVVPAPAGAPVITPGELASANSWANSNPPAAAPPPSVYGQPEATTDTAAANYQSSANALANTGFEVTWTRVQDQLARGELAEALSELSVWYGSSDVPPELESEMIELLDQLAGAVIYSREHLLEDPHAVRQGETLEDIAREYQVPWQLLANINGISDPSQLRAGDQLKVVRGPFNALVSLERQELTLIIDGRYAGRFAIGLGNDPQPRTGEFAVREKEVEKMFVDREGRTVPAGDDANPYGQYWIGLDGSLGIHGAAPAAQSAQRASTGSIIVSPDDARDLFAILSEDSKVVIRR